MALLKQSGPGDQYEESDGSRSMQVRVIAVSSGADLSEAADGAPAPTLTQQIGGKDGSGNLQSLLTDTSGRAVTAQAGPYPSGAIPIQASSGNVAAAAAVATLDSDAAKTTYIAGFEITGAGATAGLPVVVTVAGLLGGTRSYIYTAAVGVLVANAPLLVSFLPPLPASGADVDIVVTCPSLGLGNTNNVANAYGYKL